MTFLCVSTSGRRSRLCAILRLTWMAGFLKLAMIVKMDIKHGQKRRQIVERNYGGRSSWVFLFCPW